MNVEFEVKHAGFTKEKDGKEMRWTFFPLKTRLRSTAWMTGIHCATAVRVNALWPAIPVLPDWSPVAKFGGYALPPLSTAHACYGGHGHDHLHAVEAARQPSLRQLTADAWQSMGLWGSGCDCFAF